MTLTLTLRNAGGDLNQANSGGGGGTNAFFNNTGAVAGVFVVVGLVVVGILTALAFFCLRRRRRQRLDREVTAAAIAASRSSDPRSGPLDDDLPTSQRQSMHPSGSAESYPQGQAPMQQYNAYPASYGYGDPYAPVPQQYNYNDAYDYAPAAGAAGAAAGMGAGQYTDTPGQGYNYGPNGEYYFDPNQADRYRDEPSAHGSTAEDAYGGYENYDSPAPLTGGQYGTPNGQGAGANVGTPPNEQSDPLHVSYLSLGVSEVDKYGLGEMI